MTAMAQPIPSGQTAILDGLAGLGGQTLEAADRLLGKAVAALRAELAPAGRLDGAALDRAQHAAHGLAWLATYVEVIRQMAAYAGRMQAEGRFGEVEALLVQTGLAEYCSQIVGGIPMSQLEFIRLHELGVAPEDVAAFAEGPAAALIRKGNSPEARGRLAVLLLQQQGTATYGDSGLDETLEAMRGEMRRFSEAEVTPHAHEWHLANAYIPLDIIAKMSELGVFGLTIPEEYGGLALGKEAMCVVSEELSRGYIGVGSLGTRSEIAAELILGGGTPEQKAEWLPKIASGEVLPRPCSPSPIPAPTSPR